MKQQGINRKKEKSMAGFALGFMLILSMIAFFVDQAYGQTSYATYENDLYGTKHTYTNAYSAKVKFVNVNGGYSYRPYSGNLAPIGNKTLLLNEVVVTAQTQKLDSLVNGFVNCEIASYNLNNEKIESYFTESNCVWYINHDHTELKFEEFTPDGTVVKSKTLKIDKTFEDDVVFSVVVLGNDGTYTMSFWKDRSMVAYEFLDGYTLISGDFNFTVEEY